MSGAARPVRSARPLWRRDSGNWRAITVVGGVLAVGSLIALRVLTIMAAWTLWGSPPGIAELAVLSAPLDQDIRMTDGTWVIYQYVGPLPSAADPHPARTKPTLVPNDVHVSSADSPVIGVAGDPVRPDTVRHPAGMFTEVLHITGPAEGSNHVRISASTPTTVLIGPSTTTTFSLRFERPSPWTWTTLGALIGLLMGVVMIAKPGRLGRLG